MTGANWNEQLSRENEEKRVMLLLFLIPTILGSKPCKDLISKCKDLESLCFKSDGFKLIGDAKVEKVCPQTCGMCDDDDGRGARISECSLLQQKKCEQICLVDESGESRCECHPGFTVQRDGSCKDVDECATKSDPCDYIAPKCVNTPGSYFCKPAEVCPNKHADFYKRPGCCLNEGDTFDDKCGMPQGGEKPRSFTLWC